MKLSIIIAGTRTYNNYLEFSNILKYLFQNYNNSDLLIVAGGAKGADFLAKKYALENNIEYIEVNANWEKYGKSAGYKRNSKMHEILKLKDGKHGCVCFWDGKSHGTQHNFQLSKNNNERLIVYNYITKQFLKMN